MKRLLVTALPLLALNVAAEEESKKHILDGEFGLLVTTGNTKTDSYKLKVFGQHDLEQWMHTYNLSGLYKKDDSATKEQNFFVDGQANYKLDNPDNRLFIYGSYEDDRFNSYEYQSTIAVGWGQKVWEDEVSSFEYSIGPGYSFSELRDTGESLDGAVMRGSLRYLWNLSDTSKFTQSLSTEVGSDNVKSKSETAITANIYGSLAMKFSVTLDHNTEVAPGDEKLDTETAVTLVYSFF